MNKTVPLSGKELPHVSMLEWTRNIQALQAEARQRRLEGRELRRRATQLRHEADVTARWDYRLNSDACRDRIFEVSTWREHQRSCRESVRSELQALLQEKSSTEAALEGLQVPFMVTSQCFSTRDTRVRMELTRDHLQEELIKELAALEDSKRQLADACQAAWEKAVELRRAADRLQLEITNKDEALALDNYARDLNIDSAGISYKLDADFVPAGSMTERGYEECVQNTIDIAEQLMRESKCCRESMFRARERAANVAYERSHAAESALRRRAYDTERAANELKWQKDKLDNSIRQVEEEIEQLQRALAAKEAPTQVTESRLAARARRPALELVRDRATDGLLEELNRLRLSTGSLRDKLDDALATHHSMCEARSRLQADVERKAHALEAERRLLEIRAPLHRPASPRAATARNARLLRMEEQIAPLV